MSWSLEHLLSVQVPPLSAVEQYEGLDEGLTMANGSGNISAAGQGQALVAHPTSLPGINRKTNVKHAHCTNLKLILPARFSGPLAYSQELL